MLLLENSSLATVDHLLQLDNEIYMFFKLNVKGICCFSEELRVAFQQ